MLTALIGRLDRLIYLSSGLHRASAGSLRDIDWTSRSWNAAQAYAESKLHVIALVLTLARAWPEVLSNAVDPGWVPTKMGGPAATGDLAMGYLTQTWLAGSRRRWDRGTSLTSIDQMIGNGVLPGGQRLVAARQSVFQLGTRYRAAPATYAATT